MDKLALDAQVRDLGVKPKTLRGKGAVPAVLYGRELKNLHIQVDANKLAKALRQAGYSTLIDLSVDGENHTVLFQNVDRHPLTSDLIHADFRQVRLDEKIKSEIPLAFVGEAPAVKELEGTLLTNKDAVQVEALPNDLVHEIQVDISGLRTFDDIIHLRDVIAPVGISILDSPDDVVALVQPPRSEEELAALEQKVEEKVEEVKVEEKGKKEEDGEAAGEETAAEGSEKRQVNLSQ